MKKIIFIPFFVLVVGFSAFQYVQVNSNMPQHVEIRKLSLPFTYSFEGVSLSVNNYRVEKYTDPNDGSDGQYYLVVLETTIMNGATRNMTLSSVLNQLVVFNQNYGFGTLQRPVKGEDPEDVILKAGQKITFAAEYKVPQLHQIPQKVFIAGYPFLYEEQYQGKLRENVLYYEILPIEEGI